MKWTEGIMRMLRLRKFDDGLQDEAAEQDKLRRARERLRYLDIQADIVMRRAGKHEPR